jgi:hypothetical protein
MEYNALTQSYIAPIGADIPRPQLVVLAIVSSKKKGSTAQDISAAANLVR